MAKKKSKPIQKGAKHQENYGSMKPASKGSMKKGGKC